MKKEQHISQKKHAFRALLIPGFLGIVPILSLFIPVGSVDPDREFAFHFGADGKPDRFNTLFSEMVNISAILVVILIIGLIFVFIVANRNRATDFVPRMLSATTVGVIAGVAAMMLVLIAMQLQDADTATASDVGIGTSLIAFIGVGGLFALLCWWLMPGKKSSPSSRKRPAKSDPIQAKPAENLIFVTDIEPNRWVMLLIATLGFGTFLLLWLVSELIVIGVIIGVSVLVVMALLSWRVTIDASGVKLKSALGFPWFRIRIEDIDSVGVDSVDPMKDFGGWGLRVGFNDRFGIVTQKGPALIIGRNTKETDFVITIAEAQRAATVLSALLDRRNRNNQP